MSISRYAISILSAAALLSAAAVYAGSGAAGRTPVRVAAGSAAVTPLKEAKLNIEHNATDKDTASREPSIAKVGNGSTYAGRAARC